MPELPEVESIRKSLEPIVGASIFGAQISEKPLRYGISRTQAKQLIGERVAFVGRRGRFLLVGLERHGLVFHFGMSGWLRREPKWKPRPHDHFMINLGEYWLAYNDPRRFGGVFLCAPDFSDAAPLSRLGAEPLDPSLTGDQFRDILRASSAPIKIALMDNALITGIGNIYASEILFASKIDPRKKAESLSSAQFAVIFEKTQSLLAEAVRLGGSTLKDFKHLDGSEGGAQLVHAVYGKAGQACRDCGSSIAAIRQGGRSTFFCPGCQKKSRARRERSGSV